MTSVPLSGEVRDMKKLTRKKPTKRHAAAKNTAGSVTGSHILADNLLRWSARHGDNLSNIADAFSAGRSVSIDDAERALSLLKSKSIPRHVHTSEKKFWRESKDDAMAGLKARIRAAKRKSPSL